MKTKFSGFLTLLLALMVQITFAQDKEISGMVKDGDGLPLPGVNITVEGTDTGTQTDFDGNYSITVEQGATLKFSFVGFADVFKKVGMQSTIDVIMQQGEDLGAVLVETGYQTQTKRKSTKAVTTITAEDIEDRPNASAIDALQGQVAGLDIGSNSGQPGSNSTVILRGVGSLNGDIEPLFIIDGIPASKSIFTNLDGNDIESVSVLKGPSATSIYGNRGANGVIVVTTKGGKYDSSMEITYRSQYGISEIMPLNLELMTSKQKLEFLTDNGLKMPKIPGIHKGMTQAEIDRYAAGTNTDWSDIFFRKAKTNRQNVSITSGSKNLAVNTSIDYMNQEGIFMASGLQRFGFRNKINGRSDNDKFHYSTNINTSFSKSDFDNENITRNGIYFNPFMASMMGSSLVNPYNYDGSINYNGGMELGDSDALIPEMAPFVLLNSTRMNTQQLERFNLLGNFHADWNFVDHFTAGVDLGINLSELRNTDIVNPLSILGPFQVNADAKYGGIDRESQSRDARFTTKAYLSYNNTWGKHSLDISAYTEYHKNHYNSFGFRTRGLDPKLIGTSGAYMFKNKELLPGASDSDYIYAERTFLDMNYITTGLFSYFAILDYDFDERFGFSGSIRRDASVRFTKDNKWGTFWSASGRWNIDAEDFMEGSAFNLLKLRAGYGTSGNQRIAGGFYDGLDLYQDLYTGGDGYNNTSSYVPSVIANPSLKWETTKQTNVGVDFGIWKNKLQGNLDVFEKRVTDLYEDKPISLVNATSSIKANIGEMSNRGVELALRYNIVSNQDWKFSVYGNGSYTHNKLLKLAGEDENGLVFNGGPTALKVGESAGEYYSIRYAGVNPGNGHGLFYDKNGNLTEKINDADRVFENNFIYPEIHGGFGAFLEYKGFSLDQRWVYYARVARNNGDLASLEDPQNWTTNNSSVTLLDAWKTPGDITNIPALSDQYDLTNYANQTNRYIQDASYLRLRNIALGYTFNKKQLERLPFNSVKLYIQAENLLTFTKYEGYDPQSGYTGLEDTRYPSARTYTVGLNVNF